MTSTVSLDVLAQDYERVAPIFERLRRALEPAIRDRLLDAGIPHSISSRSKDFASLARKAIKKGWSDAVHRTPDLAGIRVIVPFSRLKSPAVEVLGRHFQLSGDDDKVTRYGANEFRYLGRHVQVTYKAGEEPEPDLAGRSAELQLHTRAESAWADASHDLTYKTALDLPDALHRRVNRLLALVELFDGEMSRAHDELVGMPGFPVARMLQALERAFLPLARRDFDKELSTIVLGAILPAYATGETNDFDRIVAEFARANSERLRAVYLRVKADPYANPLALQPEALAVFERVEQNLPGLRDAWDSALPAALLDNLVEHWGVVISRPGDAY